MTDAFTHAPRRARSAKQRLEIFEAARGVCHLCGGKIHGATEAWEVEHVIALSSGGSDEVDNLRPAHAKCHKVKTSADVGMAAKGKRRALKHSGAKRPGSGFAGNRASAWKKKINGEVERR